MQVLSVQSQRYLPGKHQFNKVRVLNILWQKLAPWGGMRGVWQVVEEGPGGRVGAAGGLRWREDLGPAGGSLGPVVGEGGSL